MSPQELVDRVIALFPAFAARWNEPGNCFRDENGSFTLHGVWAEFSHFFRERHEGLSGHEIATLGVFVSECVASDDAGLSNAASTCFVENIVGEECERELLRHLTGKALEYHRAWSGRTD